MSLSVLYEIIGIDIDGSDSLIFNHFHQTGLHHQPIYLMEPYCCDPENLI